MEAKLCVIVFSYLLIQNKVLKEEAQWVEVEGDEEAEKKKVGREVYWH